MPELQIEPPARFDRPLTRLAPPPARGEGRRIAKDIRAREKDRQGRSGEDKVAEKAKER